MQSFLCSTKMLFLKPNCSVMYNSVHLNKGIAEVIIESMQLKASSFFFVKVRTRFKCSTLDELYNSNVIGIRMKT